MSLPRIPSSLVLAGMVGLGVLTHAPRAAAGPLGIFDSCCCKKCPKFVYCQEGPPRIKMKTGCSRPVCDPCNLEHFGYYRTCWQPWPYPQDWSHCPVPPGTVPDWAMHPEMPRVNGPVPEQRAPLPPPRKADGDTAIPPPLGLSQ
jgi:hypothetical protein